jgi:hypothetical protein
VSATQFRGYFFYGAHSLVFAGSSHQNCQQQQEQQQQEEQQQTTNNNKCCEATLQKALYIWNQ